jgi:hypothetical protein
MIQRVTELWVNMPDFASSVKVCNSNANLLIGGNSKHASGAEANGEYQFCW